MATILITGANRGIGLEMARQLTARGDKVIAAVRSASPELAETGAEIHEGVDVRNGETISALAEKLTGTQIDLLINNAGILTRESLEELDWDAIQTQFEVNTLGPLRVVSTLLPNLTNGTKVAIVSSRIGSMTDNSSGGRYGYRISKTAVNMVGVNLANDLRERGIAVIILHPGYVRTALTGMNGDIDPDQAATGLIARIDDLTLEKSGSFWHANGEPLPW